MIALNRLRPASLWRAPPGPGFGPLPELLLTLTVVTGLVDAVSILTLGRVFVANMTGNVVFVGFAIVGAPGFSLAASVSALAGFLIGAAAGGAVAHRAGHDRAQHLRAAMGLELLLLAAALLIAATSGAPAAAHGTLHVRGAPFSLGIASALAAILATALGVQNSLARKLAVPDLTTTVLTMTLTGIGADSSTGRRGHVTLIRRLLTVAVMLAGGVLGAWLCLSVSAVAALVAATGLAAIVTACAVLAARRPGEWRQPGPAQPAVRSR